MGKNLSQLLCPFACLCFIVAACSDGRGSSCPDCDDGIACTLDSCVESVGQCDHLPSDDLRRTVAAEMCRIARKRVLVSYLDARSWTWRRRAIEHRFTGRVYTKHPLRPREMAGFFTEAGFRVVNDIAQLPLIHSLRMLVAERPE